MRWLSSNAEQASAYLPSRICFLPRSNSACAVALSEADCALTDAAHSVTHMAALNPSVARRPKQAKARRKFELDSAIIENVGLGSWGRRRRRGSGRGRRHGDR